MTVNVETNKVREDGNGVKTAFTFSFPCQNETHLEVYKVVKSTGVATLQVLNTNYTVALNTASPGGTVTYAVAPSALEESFISRVVDLTQETDFPDVGALRESQIENEFDKGRMIDQQLQEQIDRGLKLPVTSSISELNLPAPEASKYLGWNADADAIENKAAPTAVSYSGNIAFGADASKSVSPAQGDIYFAMDTGKIYLCLSGGTWTWYNPTTMTTRGDIEFRDASGKARLAAGTSGHFLKTQGAGADPVWASAAISAASQAQMEAASDNTVMATPASVKWHPGVAKAWVNFNGTGTPAVLASHNVDSSITDHGTGEYTISFTTDFSSANYAYAGLVTLAAEFGILSSQTTSAAGTKRLYIRHIDGSAKDATEICLIAFGDQ